MIRYTAPSCPVCIFIAGDYWKAHEICRQYADDVGFCVTLTKTEYVYTGGAEPGVIVGLINYPRFPAEHHRIVEHAEALAARLRVGLGQDSYSIQAPDKTVWISHRAMPEL